MGYFAKQMENSLRIRNYSLLSVKAYLRKMRLFVKYFKIPPDKLTLDDITRYQVYLVKERKVKWNTFNQSVCAIKYFYKYVVKRKWLIEHIPFQKVPKKLPIILSREEVIKLLEAPTNPKHRAILFTFYSTGLRMSELIALKPSDIDSNRMLIYVNEGKGKKDRYVILSPILLKVLRFYWKSYWSGCKDKPVYLFPGIDLKKPISRKGAWWIIKEAGKKAGLPLHKVSSHKLRHAFSTHLLESGANIRIIQELLGHRSLNTTAIYTHVAKNYLHKTSTPLDTLYKPDKHDKEEI